MVVSSQFWSIWTQRRFFDLNRFRLRGFSRGSGKPRSLPCWGPRVLRCGAFGLRGVRVEFTKSLVMLYWASWFPCKTLVDSREPQGDSQKTANPKHRERNLSKKNVKKSGLGFTVLVLSSRFSTKSHEPQPNQQKKCFFWLGFDKIGVKLRR